MVKLETARAVSTAYLLLHNKITFLINLIKYDIKYILFTLKLGNFNVVATTNSVN